MCDKETGDKHRTCLRLKPELRLNNSGNSSYRTQSEYNKCECLYHRWERDKGEEMEKGIVVPISSCVIIRTR